jgi:hypothetical protein
VFESGKMKIHIILRVWSVFQMNKKAQLRNFSTVSFRTKFYTFSIFLNIEINQKKVGDQ